MAKCGTNNQAIGHTVIPRETPTKVTKLNRIE